MIRGDLSFEETAQTKAASFLENFKSMAFELLKQDALNTIKSLFSDNFLKLKYPQEEAICALLPPCRFAFLLKKYL